MNKFFIKIQTILLIIHNQNSKSSNSWLLGKLLAPLATSLDKIYLRTRIIAVLCTSFASFKITTNQDSTY